MKRALTVRAGYLYIFIGSLLLSGISLFVVHRIFTLAYVHVSSDSFLAKLTHWLINHIGKTPIAAFMFLTVFIVVFMLRSQKSADDVKSLLRAAGELADKGSFEALEIASAGELKELASYLHRLNRSDAVSITTAPMTPPQAISEAPVIPLENEDIMALILRVRSLLRVLDESEMPSYGENSSPSETFNVEAVKREALGMERFLESLMNAS